MDTKEFYTVACADHDPNEDTTTAGAFTDIYSTFDKAKRAVMEAIRDQLEEGETLENTVKDEGVYISFHGMNMESRFLITRYSLDYIK